MICPNITVIVFYQVLYNGYFHCAEPVLDKFVAALEKEVEGNMNESKMEIEDGMIWEEYSEWHGGKKSGIGVVVEDDK